MKNSQILFILSAFITFPLMANYLVSTEHYLWLYPLGLINGILVGVFFIWDEMIRERED